jgi:site-specific DNA recombinase
MREPSGQKAPIRCAIYSRVSTEEQADKFGLASQQTEMRKFARKAGYAVAHEFADDGYKGGDLVRPGLTKVRELIRSRSIDVFLVYDPDRLARKLAHQLILTEECEKAGVRLEFVTMPNTDSMEGRLLLNVRGVIAEYEKEKIRERTLRGRREKARQGFVVGGRRPYGYKVEGGRYVVHEPEAKVVVLIFDWLVNERMPIRGILERLNELGHRPHTSPKWATSSLSRLLRNEIYTGRFFYNRRQRVELERAPGDFRRNKRSQHHWRPETDWIAQDAPPIITPELFSAAQTRLKLNSAHCSGRPSKTFYLLRGLLRCGRCGRRYAGSAVFRDRYYRCGGHQRLANPRCMAPVIAAERIEDFVWAHLVRLLSNPGLLAEKLAEQGNREEDLQKQLTQLEGQIATIRRKQERLLEAMLDGGLPMPGLKQKAAELEGTRVSLEQASGQTKARISLQRDQDQLGQTAIRYCQLLSNSIQKLDLVARQTLVRALLDEVKMDGNLVSMTGILPVREPVEKPFTSSAHCDCPPPQLLKPASPWSGRAHR